MKKQRIISFLMAVLVLSLSLLTGCGKKNDKKPGENTTKNDKDNNVRIEIQITDNENKYEVQIPKFVSDTENQAVNQLNAEIQPIIDVYNEAKKNLWQWAIIKTQQFDNERYLQAVVEYQKMPTLEANVRSFVYDKKKDRVVTLDDAYKMEKLDQKEFQTLLVKLFKEQGNANIKIKEYSVNGFYINEKKDVEFFTKIKVNDGKQDYIIMATVIPHDKKLLASNEQGIQILP